jgi:hypothetical protein
MRRLTLGVLANEFFDPELGRMGGFGWAARQIVRCFADPALGVDVVYLTGELRARPGQQVVVVHGTRLIPRQRSIFRNIVRVRAEKPDLLLAMDYRPNYRLMCWALTRTPMIVWVRDPRPPDEVAKVNTLSIPGQNGTRPQGILQPDCSSLGTIARTLTGEQVGWLVTPAPAGRVIAHFQSGAPHPAALRARVGCTESDGARLGTADD